MAWEPVFDCEQVATRAAANRKPMRLASSDTTPDADTTGGAADGKVRMVPGPSLQHTGLWGARLHSPFVCMQAAPLRPGTLTTNLGIPIVVVGTKSDVLAPVSCLLAHGGCHCTTCATH